MQSPSHVASFSVVRSGAERLDAIHYWLLDEAGRIARMKVLWRPLPALAALQRGWMGRPQTSSARLLEGAPDLLPDGDVR